MHKVVDISVFEANQNWYTSRSHQEHDRKISQSIDQTTRQLLLQQHGPNHDEDEDFRQIKVPDFPWHHCQPIVISSLLKHQPPLAQNIGYLYLPITTQKTALARMDE